MLEAKKDRFVENDPKLSTLFFEQGFGNSEGHLHPLEAAYLVQIGKTKFKSHALSSFISSQTKSDPCFAFALAAYGRIRATGRMLRPFKSGTKYLRVYAPGVGREEERASVLLCLLPKNLSPKSIEEELRLAHQARLDLVIACGTENEMKFYKINSYNF